jgi:SAM-dependent methyltransferase
MSLTSYAERWSRLPFHGIQSVVACREELAPLVQPLFRESALSRLGELTAHRHPLDRIVDLGCGGGDWTVRYTAFARHVVGIDVNPRFIDEARRVAAAAAPADGRTVELQVMSIADFDDFAGAALVSMAGCAMYLDDAELAAVADRVARAQRRGDFFYLRATVTNPLRRPHRNEYGFYRSAAFYEALFAARGYRIRERMFAASYVPIFLARKGLGIRSFRRARLLTAGMAGLLRLGRLPQPTDFQSWVFEKR